MLDFGRLLEEQIPRLRRYAVSLTRNRATADDLVQTTLVRALAKQHLFQPDTDLRAWLFTLLHNQHVNEVRKGMKWNNLVDVDDLSAGLVAVADTSARRQLGELDEAIGKLSAEQREVILPVGLEGMAYEEVAAILMVPAGTVRSRLSRGRTALRRLMGMEEEQPEAVAA